MLSMFSAPKNKPKPKPEKYQTTDLELHEIKVDVPRQDPRISVTEAPPLAPVEIKIEMQNQSYGARAKGLFNTACQKFNSALAYYPKQVSFSKRVMQTAWSGLVAFGGYNTGASIANFAHKIFSWHSPAATISGEIFSALVAGGAFVITSRSIGENLKNNVDYKHTMYRIHDYMGRLRSNILTISAVIDYVREAKLQGNCPEEIAREFEKLMCLQNQMGFQYDKLKRLMHSLSSKYHEANEAPKNVKQKMKDMLAWHDEVSLLEKIGQTTFSAVTAFELNNQSYTFFSFLLGALALEAETLNPLVLVMSLLVATGGFFLNHNTMGKGLKNIIGYQKFMQYTAEYLLMQKQFLHYTNSWLENLLKPNIGRLSLVDLNQESEEKNAFDKTCCEKINDNFKYWLSIYPQVSLQKKSLHFFLSVLAAYGLQKTSYAFIRNLSELLTLSGKALHPTAQSLSIVISVFGFISILKTVGTNASNASVNQTNIDNFLRDMREQGGEIKLILEPMTVQLSEEKKEEPTHSRLETAILMVHNQSDEAFRKNLISKTQSLRHIYRDNLDHMIFPVRKKKDKVGVCAKCAGCFCGCFNMVFGIVEGVGGGNGAPALGRDRD